MPEYWDDLQRHDGGACIEEIWLDHPLCRASVNRRISGNPTMWPTEWLRDQLSRTLPLRNAFSIGCGTGAFERDVVSKGIVDTIVGIDTAPQPLERARQLAAEAGLSSRITYRQDDATQALHAAGNSLDAVFFHASLHHFADPVAVLEAAASGLRAGGWLYLDEYAGPARTEWSWIKLLVPNVAYYLLPRVVRRPKIIRAPINREDPTEAVASSAIRDALAKIFPGRQIRPYGGNLLAVIYPNLHRPSSGRVTDEQFARSVRRLLFIEDIVLRFSSSYFIVALSQK